MRPPTGSRRRSSRRPPGRSSAGARSRRRAAAAAAPTRSSSSARRSSSASLSRSGSIGEAMPTHAGERSGGGLGAAAKAVSERVSSIVRLELELAASELKAKLAALGLGIGLLVGAGIFALFMLGFAFLTLAAALATVVSTWLALLIVTGLLLAIAGALGFIGYSSVSKGTPPLPEQAIAEAKLTTEALKNGR